MATLLRRSDPQVHERVAASLLTPQLLDTTSQGPINEIRRRSSRRLGGTIGHETPETVLRSAERRHLRPVENLEGGDFIGSVVRVGVRNIEERGRETRLTLKTVAADRMVGEVSEAVRANGAEVEGVMPLGEGYSKIYIGYNAGDRRLSAEEYQALVRATDRKVAAGRSDAELGKVLSRLGEGRRITYAMYDNKTTHISERDYPGIIELLNVFEYPALDAVRNATSEGNTVVLARAGDRVIGIAMTEHGTIQLSNGRTLHTAELTDFVVREEFGSNKVSYVMASMLLQDLFSGNIDRGMHAAFAESNLSTNIATTFSMLGGTVVEGGGILPNHINVQLERSRMESFAVMQFTREGVERSPIQSILRA